MNDTSPTSRSAIANAFLPMARMAGEEWKFTRSETFQMSAASPQPCRNTHFDSGMASSRALATEVITTAAAMSTSITALRYFVYGKPTKRFLSVGVAISSGER